MIGVTLVTSRLSAYIKYMSVDIPHMNSMQSTFSPQALVYIHFTFLAYMPATSDMYVSLH